MEIQLGKNRKVGDGHRPYLIAEMSGNHNKSLDRAIEIVEAAAKSGADALKIQTYKPETMTLNLSHGDFFISDPKSLWKGKSLYELYGEAMTPWEWHKPIKDKCEELGLDFFSTPFDDTAVDFLEELKVDFYKIASFENTDIPLLKRVASTGKPIIVSTGLANQEELEFSVQALRYAGANEIILLKCTSAYPAPPEQANLRTIPDIRSRFQCISGLSDHTMGYDVPIAAVALGAAVI
ncbi:MAG: N-acetylneuraminate synthase family protein, partial [Bdellovibrionales bacterium]|nr:N-acetylneuraminate synthase family protein [Bdellovibrionales bacterium]